MPELNVIPINQADPQKLSLLMSDEVQAWICELGWDYQPVSSILASCISRNLLPGYAAVTASGIAGYGYFLIHQNKGIVGTVYVPKIEGQQAIADEVLTHSIRSLKEALGVRRIESQIMPFHGLNLTSGFVRHGFQYFPRYFLELDLTSYEPGPPQPGAPEVVRWNPSMLASAAAVVERSYQNEADAQICEDYRSAAGCEGYLRSLVENPGCGLFIPEASFMGLDSESNACGFILSSRIASHAGMIPQIAILPSYQGRGLGAALMRRALEQMHAMGLKSVGLTVTKKNKRAYEWYQRLGFRLRKEFGAFVWVRP